MCGPEPSQQVWPHVEYIVKNYGKKFFLLGSDYAWPRETNKMFKEKFSEYGGKVVGEVYVPFNTPEYESVLRDIRASGADVVLPLSDGQRHGQFPATVPRRRHGQGHRDLDRGR